MNHFFQGIKMAKLTTVGFAILNFHQAGKGIRREINFSRVINQGSELII